MAKVRDPDWIIWLLSAVAALALTAVFCIVLALLA
jgi:hypothetical protein